MFKEIDKTFDFLYKRIENDMPEGKQKKCLIRRLTLRQKRFTEGHLKFNALYPVSKHQPKALREEARLIWVEFYEKWFGTKSLIHSDVENSIRLEMKKPNRGKLPKEVESFL